ncbi:MAG: cupredoxin domain-containing protein [bacterium]
MKGERLLVLFVALIVFSPITGVSRAEDTGFTIVIKDHQFSPAKLKIPAGKKVKVVIENQDATAEEFESYDLNREKVVAGNAKITVFLGPLKPGIYKYFGEFHKNTAQGVVIAGE